MLRFFYIFIARLPCSSHFPYTTLFRSRGGATANGERVLSAAWVEDIFTGAADSAEVFAASASGRSYPGGMYRDRKSTRLNSSHVAISYAVFCLKKKTNNED